MLEKSEITLGEFEKMIEPLNAQIPSDYNEEKEHMKGKELDFTGYSKLVIETEDGKAVCEITQDGITIRPKHKTVMDGYVGRCVPLEKESMS